MGTLNPRARGVRNLGTDRAESTADRQQIRRLVQSMPKPEVPAVAGTMQGFTRATAGGYSISNSGIQFDSWTFDTGWDISPGTEPTLNTPGSVYFGVSEEGYYGLRPKFSSDVGEGVFDVVTVEMGFSDAGLGGSHFLGANVPRAGGGDFVWYGWIGPIWLPATTIMGPLGFQAYWPALGTSPTATYAECEIDVWRLG